MTIPVTDAALDLEKTAVARCARRSPFRSWPAWVYFGVFLVSFAVFYIFWCTNSLQNYVHSQMTLRNGTDSLSFWEQPPAKMVFEVYVFNYTNMDDYLKYKADKLRVEELGPYRYLETLKRVNVEAGEDDTLTYQEDRSYEWIGGRSEDDIIVTPNVPILSSIAYVRDMNFAAQLSLTAVLTSLKEKAFIREKAGKYFWGYDDEFFRIVKPLLRLKQDVPFEKFGIFAMKKGLNKDRITINSGIQDIDKLGMFEQINGFSSLNVWGSERCDKIKGTDGTLFPPHFVNDKKTLHIYSKEMCRSIPFVFTEHVTQHSVPTIRYKPSFEAFDYRDEKNKCFCPLKDESRVCLRNGLFDISTCANDSPIIMSSPHFFGGEESLLEDIDGLHPRAEDHETYMDIYQTMALPIHGWSKLQLNVQVRKATAVPLVGRIPDGTVLPLVWINTGMNERDLPSAVVDIIYQVHFVLHFVQAVMQWSSLVGMIVSIGALLVCFKKYRMEHPDVGLQMNSVDQNKLLEVS